MLNSDNKFSTWLYLFILYTTMPLTALQVISLVFPVQSINFTDVFNYSYSIWHWINTIRKIRCNIFCHFILKHMLLIHSARRFFSRKYSSPCLHSLQVFHYYFFSGKPCIIFVSVSISWLWRWVLQTRSSVIRNSIQCFIPLPYLLLFHASIPFRICYPIKLFSEDDCICRLS